MSPSTEAGRTLVAAFVTPLPADAIGLSTRGLIQTAVPAIEAEARAAVLAELTAGIRDDLGGDLRELAQVSEKAQHCIWPTITLRLLDLIQKAGER